MSAQTHANSEFGVRPKKKTLRSRKQTMKTRSSYAALVTLLIASGCGSTLDEPGPATGGATGAGGDNVGTASGGSLIGSGGTVSSGGALGSGGGATASGGSFAAGGGTAAGGMTAAGGDAAAGGMTAAGGGSASGGGGSGDDTVRSSGCDQARTLKDGNLTMMSGGQNRQYHLRTPPNYDNTHAYRVIFMFHWFYGSINAVVNPPDADHNTDDPYYGMEDLAGDSTIFVVPQGLSDAGGAGWSDKNGQDLKFTDDMLDAISSDLCVDTSRVFTTGFSFGGAISYKLACERNDKFRAAVVYDTGGVSGNDPSKCTKPIAFFGSHGQDDGTFDYQIGLDVMNIFVKTNGCTAMTPASSAQNAHACVSFEGCTDGYPVRFCNFGSGENNPHNTSLKGHYPVPKDPGQTTSWVPGEAWNFIKQF